MISIIIIIMTSIMTNAELVRLNYQIKQLRLTRQYVIINTRRTREETEMDKKMLKPTEVAESLNVARSTVNRLIRNGDIKAIRVGRVYRIPAEELEKYLAKETTNEE